MQPRCIRDVLWSLQRYAFLCGVFFGTASCMYAFLCPLRINICLQPHCNRVEVDMTCTPARSPKDLDWPAGQARFSSPVRKG